MLEQDDYEEFDNGTGSFADIYKRVLERVGNRLRGEFIYHTNRLEGSLLPLHITRKILSERGLIESRDNKKFRANDMLLVQQTLRAMKFIHRMTANPAYEISEADIKNIHFMISEHIISNPGEYRTENLDDTTVPPSEIPDQMNELIRFINNKKYWKLDPIEQAACTHYRFSQIHPFKDFNNAIARLLMNFILIRHKLPFTIINASDRQGYLESLAKKDSIYFLSFVTRCVLNTAYSTRTKECLIPRH